MHFASMSLGIFDFLISWLTEFIIWVVGWIFELINTLLARTWFNIGTSFANILDMLQGTFKKLCGMDVYWVGTERVEGVDPLLQMFTSSNVVQILIALTLVAVVMVIIAAIIQVIRIEFTTEGSRNSKGQVFGKALKSLLMFFLVPVCCIGGVGLTNALLKTIDRATNLSSGSSTLGSTIFVSAATTTNRVRAGSDLTDPLKRLVGINGDINDTNREECAQLVDQYFKDTMVGWDTGAGIFDSGNAFCPYANWEIAFLYYNLYEMNYILYIGAVLIACGIMINAAFGMVMRLIKGVILFMVSPPIVALMPLNDKYFGDWRKAFLKNVLTAYGTIVGFNLVMMVLPVVNNIKLFQPLTLDGSGWVGGLTAGMDANGANGLITILITLTGLFMIKDMIKMIAGLLDTEAANEVGAPMAKKVGKTVGTMAAVAALPVAAAAAPAMVGIGAKLAAGGGKFAALGNSMKSVGGKLGNFAKKGGKNLVNKVVDKSNEFISNATGGEKGKGGIIDAPFSHLKSDEERNESKQKLYQSIYDREQSGATDKDFTLKENRFKASEEYQNFKKEKMAKEKAEKEASTLAAINKTREGDSLNNALYGLIDPSTSEGSTLGIEAQRNKVGKLLDGGNKGEALELLTQMLNQLRAIAEDQRTDKQKELIVKLEDESFKISQIADGDKSALSNFTKTDSFKNTGELTQSVYDEAARNRSAITERNNYVNSNKDIINNVDFKPQILLNAENDSDMEAKLNSQAEAIARKLGKTTEEVKSALKSELDRYKAEMNRMLSEKIAEESKKEGK